MMHRVKRICLSNFVSKGPPPPGSRGRTRAAAVPANQHVIYKPFGCQTNTGAIVNGKELNLGAMWGQWGCQRGAA
eukprot:352807-Chlamydomonas_euryale.AAC.5